MTTLRAASRLEYEQQDANPTNDQLKIGALQRIADAAELMARRYDHDTWSAARAYLLSKARREVEAYKVKEPT